MLLLNVFYKLPALNLFFTNALLVDQLIAAEYSWIILEPDCILSLWTMWLSPCNDIYEFDPECRLLRNVKINFDPGIDMCQCWGNEAGMKKGDEIFMFPILTKIHENPIKPVSL